MPTEAFSIRARGQADLLVSVNKTLQRTQAVCYSSRYSRELLFFLYLELRYSIQGRVKIRGNEWVNERDVEQFYSS